MLRPPLPIACTFIILSYLLLLSTAMASGGRIELNQVSIESAGGFPFDITVSGNYVLTSDLAVPANTDGIVIQAERVHLDLNGFAVVSTFRCDDTCASGSADGIKTLGTPRYVTVINGQVSGFADRCISVSRRGRVQDMRVYDCGNWGIFADEHSIVMGNQVADTGEEGILLSGGDTTAFAHNTVVNTALAGGDEPAISGGRPTAGNVCGDNSCSSRIGILRYYLTPLAYPGSSAAAVCDVGFHMASIWEVQNLTNLVYDTTRGLTETDSGQSMPSNESITIWVRTGTSASPPFEDDIGRVHCEAYTTNNPLEYGTVVYKRDVWPLNGDGTADLGWVAETNTCDSSNRVICIED